MTNKEEIKEKLARNGGTWDLTGDDGEPMVYDKEKEMPIPDLALHQGEPCAVIPLGYLCDETIERINEVM